MNTKSRPTAKLLVLIFLPPQPEYSHWDDTLALRLISELVDLRAGNTNL